MISQFSSMWMKTVLMPSDVCLACTLALSVAEICRDLEAASLAHPERAGHLFHVRRTILNNKSTGCSSCLHRTRAGSVVFKHIGTHSISPSAIFGSLDDNGNQYRWGLRDYISHMPLQRPSGTHCTRSLPARIQHRHSQPGMPEASLQVSYAFMLLPLLAYSLLYATPSLIQQLSNTPSKQNIVMSHAVLLGVAFLLGAVTLIQAISISDIAVAGILCCGA